MTLLISEVDVKSCNDCPCCDDFEWCKFLHKKIEDANSKREDCPLIHIDDASVIEALRVKKI